MYLAADLIRRVPFAGAATRGLAAAILRDKIDQRSTPPLIQIKIGIMPLTNLVFWDFRRSFDCLLCDG